MSNKHETLPDLLRPFADAIKRELRSELMAELRAEIIAARAESTPHRIMMSIDQAAKRYGAGRMAIKSMIRDGRIPAIERMARGGHIGQFLHIADCERVLAGRDSIRK
jgi:excisionase family DNA binding protein